MSRTKDTRSAISAGPSIRDALNVSQEKALKPDGIKVFYTQPLLEAINDNYQSIADDICVRLKGLNPDFTAEEELEILNVTLLSMIYFLVRNFIHNQSVSGEDFATKMVTTFYEGEGLESAIAYFEEISTVYDEVKNRKTLKATEYSLHLAELISTQWLGVPLNPEVEQICMTRIGDFIQEAFECHQRHIDSDYNIKILDIDIQPGLDLYAQIVGGIVLDCSNRVTEELRECLADATDTEFEESKMEHLRREFMYSMLILTMCRVIPRSSFQLTPEFLEDFASFISDQQYDGSADMKRTILTEYSQCYPMHVNLQKYRPTGCEFSNEDLREDEVFSTIDYFRSKLGDELLDRLQAALFRYMNRPSFHHLLGEE